MKLWYAVLAVCFVVGLTGCIKNSKEKKPVTVGVYYFGGWAGKNAYADDPNEPWAKDAPSHLTRRLAKEFAGREPLWGWRDDTQETMERQIDLAADNGVDFFLFCWYWRDGKRAINKGAIESASLHTGMNSYMKAKNKEKIKYCLLVANHDGSISGDKNWEDAVTYWAKYFRDPQYITVDNKPLLVLFDVDSITDNQFAIMQETARKEGFKNGLSIAGCYEKAKKRAGCAYSTNYNGAIGYEKGSEAHPYQELIDDTEQQWTGTEEQPHIPLVNTGVDYRPWEGRPPEGTGGCLPSWYFPDNTPDLFKNFLTDAVRWMDNNPTKTTKERIVVIYAWNELGEGGYLVPTKGDPEASKLKKIKEL
ncbi:MAG: glycoside hydrolase family 99-like domain-containing protein [Dysgonamonadaceae bacterium]|jgi:hypothetical protein|nr:glycoside hydrolase family 99-like domain-containing protein [Dysgonamonadaceae bacterium]